MAALGNHCVTRCWQPRLSNGMARLLYSGRLVLASCADEISASKAAVYGALSYICKK
ncbi:hypothetical protein SAMN05216214_11730 [Atopomonas hussainii]|uniref:Uncharacterized protein n=1 Tax=Atopomonas hussainii TaxID=1429083 RepID=A0A1H7S511_9GAMM|nr:hypothetical protein SAMN05216214_11730 [Atopomonas hussainii]